MSSQYPVTRFEKIVFYLFVFLIPLQKRLIFARWTLPFQEWTAGFVYASDLLILMLLILWSVRIYHEGRQVIVYDRYDWLLVGLFVTAGFSMSHALIVPLALFRWMKFAEWLLLYWYIKSNIHFFSLERITQVLVVSGTVQAIIAIGQSFKQASLGLRTIGESPLAISQQGVAVFMAGGHKVLRVYGTLPHPNVLALLLVCTITANWALLLRPQTKTHSWDWRDVVLGLSCALMLWALCLTYARTVIFLWLGLATWLLILMLAKQHLHTRRLIIIAMGAAAVLSLFAFTHIPEVRARLHVDPNEEAVAQRLSYDKIAGATVYSHPFFGVGIGQFVPDFMRRYPGYPLVMYQPVHNIYLLIASEIGIIGVLAFVVFLSSIFMRLWQQKQLFKMPFSICAGLLSLMVLLGMVDHLTWTLQQGSVLFWSVLGLCIAQFDNL